MVLNGRRLRALVVEDDQELRVQVVKYLSGYQIECTDSPDLATARALATRQEFDVVILAVALGDDEALRFAHQLVARNGPPIIVVSASAEEADRILGLEMGVDDYLSKPFSMRELLARIRVVTRRHRQPFMRSQTRRILCFGPWRLDLESRESRHDDSHTADLTTGEFELLRALLAHPHRVLSRHDLRELMNRDASESFGRSIDVLINRLRHHLEDDPHHPRLIQTIRGGGYRLAVDVVEELIAD